MAERAKRRVAAARLAVAFAAAGTLAGATAWASPDTSRPTLETYAKGEHIKKATLQLRSDSIVNGSLLFEDFKKGEVVSAKQFQKVEIAFKKHKSEVTKDISTIKGEISTIKGEVSSIKGELGSYIKSSDADARYIKVTDDVVRGDGSVFTASTEAGVGQKVNLLDVPAMFTVDATGPVITITNESGSPLSHTDCGQTVAGTIAPGQSLSCPASTTGQTLQIIAAGAGGGPHVSTLSFSGIPAVSGGGTQITVQILIGL